MQNVVKHNHTALLSDSRDVKGLTANLIELVDDGGMRKKFSENGWGFVNEKFDYNRLVTNMKNLYKQLL